MTIGGTLFVHDAIRQDYVLEPALDSLLGVCDEVVVVDADSTDGTLELLRDRTQKEPRMKLIQAPWNPVPGRNGQWLSDLGNLARSHLKTPWHFALQADEVLYEVDYPTVRKYAQIQESILVQRLNFVRDAKHLIPHLKVCGHCILRGAPTAFQFQGDAENLQAPLPIETPIRIFHVGFLRRLDALIEKSIGMEQGVWGIHNPLFDRMKIEGSAPWNAEFNYKDLLPYKGDYPKFLKPWLKDRGYL